MIPPTPEEGIYNKMFYHGSSNKMKVGTVLKGRGLNYINDWSSDLVYQILEKERPNNYIPHYEAVFMVDNIEDIDNAGGATDYIFHLKPLGPIERHDMSFQSEILIAISDKKSLAEIKLIAKKYWTGISSKEPVWEYLTREAIITKVEKY